MSIIIFCFSIDNSPFSLYTKVRQVYNLKLCDGKEDITAKVLQQQIADELKVSLATVSLALSNKYGVNEETRNSVLLKAAELGYKFKIKQSKKTNIIAIVVDSLSYFSEANYWANVFRGIESVIHNENAVLKLCFTKRDKAHTCKEILAERMNGIILVNQDKDIVDLFASLGTAVVQLDSRTDLCWTMDHILANNYQGGSFMAKYLYDAGHRNIVFVGNKHASLSFKQRMDSFILTLLSNEDNTVNYYRVGDCDDKEKLFDTVKTVSYIKHHKEVTAIAAANDRIAYELYQLLKQEGIRVPEDISLIGFDGDASYTTLDASLVLTTIDIPKIELGRRSAIVLFRRMNGLERSFETILINCSLREGNSVKK